MVKETTIQEFLAFLSPELAELETPPLWPPDAFGLAAAVLLESGAYLSVVSEWPNLGAAREGFLDGPPDKWCARLEEIGHEWRRGWDGENLPTGTPPRPAGSAGGPARGTRSALCYSCDRQ